MTHKIDIRKKYYLGHSRQFDEIMKWSIDMLELPPIHECMIINNGKAFYRFTFKKQSDAVLFKLKWG